MGARKSFLLRIDEEVLDALKQWADEDLRSLNGQMEWLLRRALEQHGRKITPKSRAQSSTDLEGGKSD